MILIRNLALSLVAGIASVAAFAPTAFAQIITIDQTKALAGGVTPGDGAGFPVTLSEAGTYRITSNLDVSPFPETSAIVVTEHNVTIYADGFQIQGAVICSGTPSTCTPADSGSVGIFSSMDNVTVVDGTIHRFGTGVALGTNGKVRGIRALSNAGTGILIDGAGGTVQNSVVDGNAGNGIVLTEAGGWIAANVAKKNEAGIEAVGGTVISQNTAFENSTHGIATGYLSTAINNSANDNGTYGILAGRGTVVTGNAAGRNDIGIFVGDGSLAQGNTLYENISVGMTTGEEPAYLGNVIQGSSRAMMRENGKGATRIGRGACNGSKLCNYRK
jgi:hypothetical protein